MKRKVVTLLAADIIRAAKRQAAAEGRPLSDLIHDALRLYLRQQFALAKERRLARQVFCERPIRVTAKQRRLVLEEDLWAL